MTTPLTKSVARAVALNARDTLVVTLTLAGVQFRRKGTRTSYLLPYGMAFQRAATLEADRQRSDRGGARSRRASRGLLAVGGAR